MFQISQAITTHILQRFTRIVLRGGGVFFATARAYFTVAVRRGAWVVVFLVTDCLTIFVFLVARMDVGGESFGVF